MAEILSSPENEERKADLRLSLPDKEAAVEGMHSIGIGKTVSLKITGEVTRLETYDWDGGEFSFSMKPSSVIVEDGDTVISLDDAITKAAKTA